MADRNGEAAEVEPADAEEDGLITIKEAMVLARCSREMIYKWADAGHYKIIHPGGSRMARIARKDYLRFLHG